MQLRQDSLESSGSLDAARYAKLMGPTCRRSLAQDLACGWANLDRRCCQQVAVCLTWRGLTIWHGNECDPASSSAPTRTAVLLPKNLNWSNRCIHIWVATREFYGSFMTSAKWRMIERERKRESAKWTLERLRNLISNRTLGMCQGNERGHGHGYPKPKTEVRQRVHLNYISKISSTRTHLASDPLKYWGWRPGVKGHVSSCASFDSPRERCRGVGVGVAPSS